MRIDHVIYVTADLDGAARRIGAELGLEVQAGGRHEGMGTANRIVALGGGYLEIVAVVDEEEAAASSFGGAVQARLASAGEGLYAWAVAVEDVEPVAARLGTDVGTISREGLSARLAGVAEALGDPALPFFIARDEGVADPGADGDAGGIAWVEVAGDGARLEAWLGGTSVPARVVGGDVPGVRAFGLGERRVEFSPAAA